MTDATRASLVIQAGRWIECKDARQSNGALTVGHRYIVESMENATNVWIDGVGSHFWHIDRFFLVDGPHPAEIELLTAAVEAPEPAKCSSCGAPSKTITNGQCTYCNRRRANQ